MRLVASGIHARRSVLAALIALPAGPRAFALDSILFVVVGRSPGHEVRGWSVPRACFETADWFVVLLAGDQLADVLAHEVGHAVSGDPVASAEREAVAAGLAREWGFDGHAADPDACADDFEDPRAAVRAVLTAEAVELRCTVCDGPMVVLAPTAAGLVADIGAECPTCDRVDLIGFADLIPCACGQRASVTWSERATPEHPEAVWACECGTSVTRTIMSPPETPERESALIVPGLDEPAASYYLRRAAFVLTVRNRCPEPDAGSVWWACHQLRRAVSEMEPADPRRAEVEAAVEALVRGDTAAQVAGILDAMLAPAVRRGR